MKEDCNLTIGKTIRALRELKGLTLSDVAEKLGFSESDLSRKEKGKRAFTHTQIKNLAEYFDVPISFLYGEPKTKSIDNESRILIKNFLTSLSDIYNKDEFYELLRDFVNR